MPLLRPKGGTSGACVPALTPQGGARPPAHHSNFTPPLRCGDRWRSGDGGARARGDQLLTPSPHGPYTAVADTGAQVSVAGRLLLGALSAYPNVSSRLHPRQSPTLPGGSMRFLDHHLSGLRGDCPPPQSASP
ncbi:hypothetical protein GWK47_018997 [Chionoecetes opilio]|uniref:Uncharacterized protein n=1 Tax=Chionoecetes opilio TaxID=41210 RepID=A0A8J5BXL6_CHIOP|nr:hypothetical protein GWK47_018997 [Chionoecetes opilio]